MAQKGLNKESVVRAAVALIEQKGMGTFSMRLLADTLEVKTASLYNHICSMENLMTEVCLYALDLQMKVQMKAIEGKKGEDAIFALAEACRSFAREHMQLYRLIMSVAASGDPELNKAAVCIIEPFMKVLQEYRLSEEENMHWQRVLRGIIHGFVSQEDAGFFSHFPANVDISFHTAIQCYVDGLKLVKEGHELGNE